VEWLVGFFVGPVMLGHFCGDFCSGINRPNPVTHTLTEYTSFCVANSIFAAQKTAFNALTFSLPSKKQNPSTPLIVSGLLGSECGR
jgi:hypothetical protein